MSDEQRSGVGEAIVKIATALGASETRMRWRLQRLENRWRSLTRRAEQRLDHIRYRHKVCPKCTAVADRGARTCSVCGTALGSRLWQRLDRIGLVMPEVVSASTLLGICFIAVYARMMFGQAGDSVAALDPYTLIRFGGNFGPLTEAGEWWRLLSSTVGHVGLWHLGFNLVALYIIGPEVEELYGRFVMPLLFAVTGVAGSLASTMLNEPVVSVGASGGIMGLIGIAAAWGHRDGTSVGRAVRDRMIKWTLYTFIFGFAIGADNWAHAGGLALGLAIGAAVRPEWIRARPGRRVPLSLLGVAAVAAAVWLAVAPPASTMVP
jgi:rhomboid protease GluP